MPVRTIRIANFKVFPPEGRVIPPDGELAPINLFIGPNGSGKSTLLGALELVFGYDTQTTHGHGSHDGILREPERAMPNRDEPLEICAAYRWPDGRDDEFRYRYDTREPHRRPRPQRVGYSLTPSREEHPRNRVFALGWRRFRDSYDGETAFAGPNLTNFDAIAGRAWNAVRDAARHLFGFDPGADWAGAKAATDAGGGPALQNSDGYAAVLYLLLEVEKFAWETTFTIEEPESHLHPGLQRAFVEYVHQVTQRSDHPKHQFMITTRSPPVMAAVLALPFEVRRVFRVARGESGATFQEVHAPSDAWDAAASLGHRPADVLQPNGIIWVEGPSDVLYVKAWMDAFTREHRKPPICWGLDAEVIWYGGSNLCHCGVSPNVWDFENSPRQIMELLTLNPNAVVVMDRDDYDAPDRSRPAKDAVINAVAQNVRAGRLQDTWLTASGTRDIEDYVPQWIWKELQVSGSMREREKVRAASRYGKWTRAENKLLSPLVDADLDLVSRIDALHALVERWRNR